ncbi:uncharacterized protein LOC135838562 [Planococcus citri]|uniref:uncharacterized protein LOC135838562 n=1 Tax=Planococcus citri TaxID=170843 RepID=UPI0031F9E7BC
MWSTGIMNSLQIVLVFSLSITFAFADPPSQSQSPVVLEDKDKKATEECNATIPVQRHTRTVLGSAIATGSTFRLTQDEKCFLNCFLQKVGFLDANTSSIRNGPGLVNYTLRHSPELVKYSDVLIAQIFQINRVTRGFTDNCFKAYLIYHQFAQNIFVLAIADGLQSYSGVKDKLTTATQTGQDVNPDLSKQINEFLGFFDTLVTSIAKEAP